MQTTHFRTPNPATSWTNDPDCTAATRRPSPLIKFAAILTVLATTFGIHSAFTTAQASAAPVSVGYEMSVTTHSVVLQLRTGGARIDHGQLSIRNAAGTELGRVPLGYRMEDRWYPIDAKVVGKRVTLTPSRLTARSQPVNRAEVAAVRDAAQRQVAEKPRSRQERDQIALRQFNDQVQAGMTVSSLIGMAIGAVVGGAIGCLLGVAAAVVGCLVGVVPAAAIGGLVGTIIGGGGSAIVAAIQYFQTITSPFPG